MLVKWICLYIAVDFTCMLIDSLKYDLRMKHTVNNETSDILQNERDLSLTQLLTLHYLYSLFGNDSTSVYENFLNELDEHYVI